MVQKHLYQDKYNTKKTWIVCYMKGAMYLKQFIDGKQFGKGLRCTKAQIKQIGIFDFKRIA